MKLADWSLYFYRLPYRRAVTWAYAAESSSDYALLKLTDDDGTVGIAEGVVKPARTGFSPRSLAVTLEEVMLPRLRGVDLADAAAVARAFDWIDGNRSPRAMLDNACWSMRAAAGGKPLWRQWGGAPEVSLSWIVTRQAPALMAAEAADMCRRHGLRSLKLKGGQGRDTDLRVIAEVRAAVGAGIELSMDANRAYPQEGIGDYLRAIADAGVAVAEDPCPLAPDSAFERLQRDCPIPLLVDYACTSREDAALFLDRGARSLMLKPARTGIAEARDIDALCAARAARVSLGMYYESGLGTMLTLQAAAGLKSPLALPPEHSFFLILAAQVTNDLPEIKDGKLRLPEEANLETLVDWAAVERLKL
ncbi:MAG: mandelate racemase/muconate lactonizing enzyme family protein, partial [Betaproteobacteria bacterium]